MKISIIGAGAWGKALSHIFEGPETLLWRREGNISLEDAGKSEIIVNALPSFAIKDVFARMTGFISPKTILINASKGMDVKTHEFPHEIFNEIFDSINYFSLSGPSFADGLLKEEPSVVVLAGEKAELLDDLSNIARKKNLQFVFSRDIMGTEWSGTYKNVIAIAVGLSTGLGFRQNTNAFVFSKGLREMVNAGLKMGAEIDTFFNPAGVGDLSLTTNSIRSRNFSFGLHLASEKDVNKIFEKLEGVAEGYYTLQSVSFLQSRYKFDLPLSKMLLEILNGKDSKKTFLDFLSHE